MPSPAFDRDELLEHERPRPERDSAEARSPELEWASTVGNSAVQRMARSPAGKRAPVGPGAMPLATGVLARQSALDEEELTGNESEAVAEEPAAAGGLEAEAAEPEAAGAESSTAEAAAAPESAGEEPLEEELD
jgi:hypothetical protein